MPILGVGLRCLFWFVIFCPGLVMTKGHPMEKPTHLAGDLPGLSTFHKTLPKKMRDKFRQRRAKRRTPCKPYVKGPGGRVTGTKH